MQNVCQIKFLPQFASKLYSVTKNWVGNSLICLNDATPMSIHCIVVCTIKLVLSYVSLLCCYLYRCASIHVHVQYMMYVYSSVWCIDTVYLYTRTTTDCTLYSVDNS